jgi:hypothetical protein
MGKDITSIKYSKLKIILKKLIKKRKILRVMVNECVKLLTLYRKKYIEEISKISNCDTDKLLLGNCLQSKC